MVWVSGNVSSILRVAIRFSYERLQKIRPLLQLINSQVQDITYADHADELFSIFNRNVSDIAREHRRGHVRDAVIRRTGYHGLRHEADTGIACKLALCSARL